MKKQIILLLSISILLAVAGGTYLLVLTERRSSAFGDLILLHQVEILRERLLLDIRKVEADLYSQRTRHPESVDAMVTHVDDMENSVKTCLECHHEESVMARLYDLDHQVNQFSRALSRTLTLRANSRRMQDELEKTHLIASSLINKVNTMIILTNIELGHRTENALRDVQRAKLFIIVLVAAGPLMLTILGFSALGSFTKPIQVLLAATRKVKAGDLDARIAGLKNEFAELGDAFDDMAHSLRENMRAIQESEKRYRLLFESAADAIFILTAEGEEAGGIVQANQAAARMHGYSVTELLTMNIKDLDSPEAAAGIPARIDELLRGAWMQAQICHRKKDGTVFPVEISAGLFEVGGQKYILAIDRDITERKDAEVALQRAEQDKIVGEMAAGLAHEIKNPLAGLKVTMEILSEESYLAKEDRDALKRATDEIRRIEYLMKGLLNFARPPKLQFEMTDVNAVLEAVASLAIKDRSYKRDKENSIYVIKDFEANLPETLADPMQLQQIFMNLLLNAADAMPKGGTLFLKTRFDAASDILQITVSDTGTGIDASVMNSIFKPFFTTKAKGSGLGLAITKRLIEEHGGRISIENNTGRGARFTISLPATRKGVPTA
jgi:two-component system, NtrC family, sensor histidine kinase AtoS